MDRSRRPLVVALVALAVFAVVLVGGGLIGWWEPAANEQPTGEASRWCERVSGGVLREPINTLGNLGFVAAGLAMLAVLARDTATGRERRNSFIGNQPVALLYAGAALFLGPGSMLMHGSHTFLGAWLDNLSMVIYIVIPWLWNLSRLGGWRLRTFFSAYAAIIATWAVLYWVLGPGLGIGLDLFAVSIPLWLISEALFRWWSPLLRAASGLLGFAVALVFGITPWEMAASPGEFWWVVLFWLPGLLARGPATGRRTYLPWFWAGAASFLAAFAIWTTGTDGHPWCRPDSLLQAHAGWHLLCAAATWCFFLFLRTERPISGPAGTAQADSAVDPAVDSASESVSGLD